MLQEPVLTGKRTASTLSKLSKQTGSLFVPARRGGNIKKGEDPGHEELRKREKVCQVDLSNHFLSHELGKPAYEKRKGKIVGDEKKRGRNDKSRLGGEKMFETRAGGYGCPIDGILLFGSGQLVVRFRSRAPLRGDIGRRVGVGCQIRGIREWHEVGKATSKLQ